MTAPIESSPSSTGHESESALPAAVVAAWDAERSSGRGARAELNLAGIVDVAIVIADADGLSAVSMARVAKRLDFTPMALYRHVGSKQELLALMQDAATGAPPRGLEGVGWREGLAVWARESLATHAAHPWLIEIPVTGPPLMPRSLEWMDWALGMLADTPLTPLERLSTLQLINGYVRNEVSLARSLDQARAVQGPGPENVDEGDAYESGLRRFATAERFPALHALLQDGLFSGPATMAAGDEDDFMLDFGLQRLLDGVGALIVRRLDPTGP
jgi:AcrR family transcriptional regulator